MILRAPAAVLWLVAVLAIGGLFPSACDKPASAPRSAATHAQPRPNDLDTAFTAAFGAPPPAMRVIERDGGPVTLRYRPVKLIDLGGRSALISEARTDGCHGCFGALAVDYLVPTAEGFRVIGAWPELAEGGSFGEPPNWTLRTDLFSGPAIEARAGGTWQGCTVSYADVFELAAARPILRAKRILVTYDDDAHPDAAIEGVLRAELKDHAFAVDYDSTPRRTVEYRPTGEAFEPAHGEPGLPSC